MRCLQKPLDRCAVESKISLKQIEACHILPLHKILCQTGLNLVSLRNAAGWYTSCFGRSEAETSKLPLRNMFGFASSQLPTFQIRVRDEMEPFYQTADSRIDCSHRAGWCATTFQLPTASSSHFFYFGYRVLGVTLRCPAPKQATGVTVASD